jgi:hypothetical protein
MVVKHQHILSFLSIFFWTNHLSSVRASVCFLLYLVCFPVGLYSHHRPESGVSHLISVPTGLPGP